jgi:hypothetical protein
MNILMLRERLAKIYILTKPLQLSYLSIPQPISLWVRNELAVLLLTQSNRKP